MILFNYYEFGNNPSPLPKLKQVNQVQNASAFRNQQCFHNILFSRQLFFTKFSSVPLLGSLLHIWSPSEAMLRHIQNTLEITIYFRSLNTTCDLIKVNIDNLPICSSCYGAKAFSKRFFLIQCKIGFLDRFSSFFPFCAAGIIPTTNLEVRINKNTIQNYFVNTL